MYTILDMLYAHPLEEKDLDSVEKTALKYNFLYGYYNQSDDDGTYHYFVGREEPYYSFDCLGVRDYNSLFNIYPQQSILDSDFKSWCIDHSLIILKFISNNNIDSTDSDNLAKFCDRLLSGHYQPKKIIITCYS